MSPFPDGDLNLAGFDEDSSDNIAENRRRFLNVFDGPMQLATVWQIHGDAVKTVATEADIHTSDDRADADPFVSADVYAKVIVKPFRKTLP